MDEQPRNVKQLLVELKDASELIVDLAYAAVFFNEEKLAQEVERLEQRMSDHLRRLRITAMLAARNESYDLIEKERSEAVEAFQKTVGGAKAGAAKAIADEKAG